MRLETLVRFRGWEDPLEKGHAAHSSVLGLPWWLSLVKNPPAMRETWVQSLVWEDLLQEEMAALSSILAWRIPMNRGAWWLPSMGSHRVGHN